GRCLRARIGQLIGEKPVFPIVELYCRIKRRVPVALAITLLAALAPAASASASESLDPSFGEGGISLPGPEGDVNDLAEDMFGRLIAGGRAGIENTRILRFQSSGVLDQSFGGGDGRIFGPGARANAIAVQPDGKILVAGSTE